jgi:hypothetical protein
MPQGKGTYGTKKGRPPKKQMPSHVGLAAKLKARKNATNKAQKKY